MKESIHYLLMADHFLVQKDIAKGCHIEPASITVILKGMETKGYIERKMLNGDRRSLYVFLTDKGKEYIDYLNRKFKKIENAALKNFNEDEKQKFMIRRKNNNEFKKYENQTTDVPCRFIYNDNRYSNFR